MFVIGNLLGALATIVDMVLMLYMWVIIARALISWVNPDPYNPVVQFLHRATEPVMEPVRRFLPMGNIGLDISPIVVIFAIIFLQNFLVPTLHRFAFMLGSGGQALSG